VRGLWRHKGFAVGFGRGLGVLMGASVGLGFGYLGGVVVLVWGGGLRRSRWIEEGGGVFCGSLEGRIKEEKRNEEREKKS
jgi:hypothetical protein